MANIMVNEACNLRCPYCFADEFVNKTPKEMTVHDFRKAMNFVMSDPEDRQVGIIGGEPMLYTHIDEVMRIALSDPRTEIVMIYTNAVDLDKLAPDIQQAKKFRMLVNCNSPEDMGEAAFEKMRQNLLRFHDEHVGANRFRLSVNIYKPDFDYSYVLRLAEELPFDIIRLSVSVPQNGELGGRTPLEYFQDMKPVALRFVADMVRNGAITGFDCNFLPPCVLTKEERESLEAVKDVLYASLSKQYSETLWQRAIVCEVHNCSPVIDILPDLRAIRCFGLSQHTKQDIHDYPDINALREYYVNTVDRPAIAVSKSEHCNDCLSRECGDCSGGCLLFKAEELFSKV